MTVIEEDEEPEDIDNTLALPEDASPTGVESSQFGIDTANQAREEGREFGQQTAEQAQEMGQEFGQQIWRKPARVPGTKAIRENVAEERRQNIPQNPGGGAP
ncbi:MAG: hypothetical protein U5P41_05960 [Gammaproteobacteria bacterium]|nr:hypothetical protein [Gammaproteobacteria bacterium]